VQLSESSELGGLVHLTEKFLDRFGHFVRRFSL
jgi:hypothetical protein